MRIHSNSAWLTEWLGRFKDWNVEQANILQHFLYTRFTLGSVAGWIMAPKCVHSPIPEPMNIQLSVVKRALEMSLSQGSWDGGLFHLYYPDRPNVTPGVLIRGKQEDQSHRRSWEDRKEQSWAWRDAGAHNGTQTRTEHQMAVCVHMC